MAMKWNLTEVLETLANQKTSPPAEKVVTIPGLDKMARAIMDLQRRLVIVDGDEHALVLAVQKMERERDEVRSEIFQRRNEIIEQMRHLQNQIVDAIKPCGIMASVPEAKAGPGYTPTRRVAAEPQP